MDRKAIYIQFIEIKSFPCDLVLHTLVTNRVRSFPAFFTWLNDAADLISERVGGDLDILDLVSIIKHVQSFIIQRIC